ncbi:MAG: hypothetical protein ACRBDX_04175 [Gammaproteobacteria bacterium]
MLNIYTGELRVSDTNYNQKFKERRVEMPQAFPLMDSRGAVIASERRRGIPDPRFGGIELTKLSLSQKEFEDYFDNIKQ